MADPAAVQAGVTNLIRHCATVEPGEAVLLLNERGALDPELAALLEQAVAEAGGVPYSLWVDSLGRVEELPAPVAGAVLGADKLLMNCNLNRAVLLDHLRGERRGGTGAHQQPHPCSRGHDHAPRSFRLASRHGAGAPYRGADGAGVDLPRHKPARHRGHGASRVGERGCGRPSSCRTRR